MRFTLRKQVSISTELFGNPDKFGRKIVALALLGVLVREVFAPFTGHPFDFELWVRLGYYVSRGVDPYTVTAPIPGLSMPGAGDMTWIGYPPTWGFFQAGLYSLFSASGLSNRFAYYLLIKQPMIAADVLCGLLILRIVASYAGRGQGARAFAFWLLCPVTVIVSSIWGMFDQIILMIVLLSVLLFRETRKSALLSALGFVLKVIPIIYVPLLALSQESRRRAIQYLIVGAGVSVIVCLAPYLAFSGWKVDSLIGVGTDVAQKRGSSVNYWNLLFQFNLFGGSFSPLSSTIVHILSYAWIPAVLYAAYIGGIAVKSRSAESEEMLKFLLLSMQFVTLVFFLTKTVINEQYVIYFLGFGLIDYYVTPAPVRRRKLFHLIWITDLAFLVANNTLMMRFFEPLSTYYQTLSSNLTVGLAGMLRYASMDAIAMVFSILCFLYLYSLYKEIRRIPDDGGSIESATTL